MDLTLNSVNVTVINPKINIFVQPPRTERGFKAYRDDFRNPKELEDYSNDVMTFYGSSVAELREDMQKSIEEYFVFCKEQGREPEEPSSLS